MNISVLEEYLELLHAGDMTTLRGSVVRLSYGDQTRACTLMRDHIMVSHPSGFCDNHMPLRWAAAATGTTPSEFVVRAFPAYPVAVEDDSQFWPSTNQRDVYKLFGACWVAIDTGRMPAVVDGRVVVHRQTALQAMAAAHKELVRG